MKTPENNPNTTYGSHKHHHHFFIASYLFYGNRP